MAEIKLHHVSKIFNQVRVIDSLDLVIPDGKFTVLVGPSGCGKTTLLRMIAGLGPATSGQVLMDGQDITDLDPGKRRHRHGFPELCDLSHDDRTGQH